MKGGFAVCSWMAVMAVVEAVPVKPVRTGIAAGEVRLLEGPFRDAQGRDLEYLLRLEPDRLLSGMRAAAGLEPKGALYGGWERNGSGMVGHYLSACAWMAAATGDRRVRERMDSIVAEMAECQNRRGEGGLYASRWEADEWYAKLGRGEGKFGDVLPWYVAHKTLAGLRDAWKTGGNAQAREVLVRYADWCVAITSKLTDAQWAEMTSKELGAPNEVFADLYESTGNGRYLELARRFSKEPVVSAMERNDWRTLYQKHANTEIPLFTGYQRIHEVSGEERWHKAALNFWNGVARQQTFCFGGDSIWEAFIDPAEYERKLMEDCGPETCNTYNMLKLTRLLDGEAPRMEYQDFIERALFNHILTSIGPPPENGFAYYTPTRPGHYKRYSKPFDAFWCCVGSGMENHARYGDYIYGEETGRLLVNQFIPSQVRWKAMGVELRQTTTLPEGNLVRLTVKTERPREFTLSIRIPFWTRSSEVRLNGKTFLEKTKPGSWFDVKRVWKPGDVLQVFMPPQVRVENTPGGGFVSYFHGPVLLAAPLGTEGLAAEDFLADGSAPFVQLGRKELAGDKIPKVTGGLSAARGKLGGRKNPALAYPLRTTRGTLDLVPFYRIGHERYSVYFPVEDD